jgi:putative addiction module component (TIGR02574 family)
MASTRSLGIDRLPVEERLILIEEIWDSIAADTAAMPLTDAQRAELRNRIEEDDANPDDVTPLGAGQGFRARTSAQVTLGRVASRNLCLPQSPSEGFHESPRLFVPEWQVSK